jgi:AbiV family abortive infection protein
MDNDSKLPKPYSGRLNAEEAASAIQAARLNAIDLLDTAGMLYTLKRFPHAMALSILAIEEATKVAIVFHMFLNSGNQLAPQWKRYRAHRAKTAWLNPAIESRIRATFPEMPAGTAKDIGKRGPTSEQLELDKQLAFYSDCLDLGGKFVCHLPRLRDWRRPAWERLCEAEAIVLPLRDYSPDELGIWLKHIEKATAEGRHPDSVLPELQKELLQKGFIQEGWWDTILQDLADNPNLDT